MNNPTNRDLSVIIPTYNEEGNVMPLYTELRGVLSALQKTYEVVFIDDGSTDRTFVTLTDIAKSDDRVRIIKFRKNFGQTAATAAGFKYAQGKVIIAMDADLQNDPADIVPLLEKVEQGFDVVSGWRKNRKDPYSKRIISAGANLLRKLLLNDAIHDSGCTLKAYRREAVQDLDLYGEMHRFIPALIAARGFRIGEIIVRHRPRRAGKTKYSMSRVVKGFMDMLIIKFWMQYGTRPAHLFGGIGLTIGTVGFLIALVLSMEKIFFGVSLSNRPLLLLSVFMIISGIQLVVFGFLADIMTKIYYASGKRESYTIERTLN